jgi:Tfp pilus assembly protein PilN
MTTTMEPPVRPDPGPVEPTPAGPGASGAIRVFANLLPDEIVAARRLGTLKRRLVIGLAGLVAVLVLFEGFSWVQTHNAGSSLSSSASRTKTLQRQLQGFQPLIDAQSKSVQIQSTLTSIMKGDLQWKSLLSAVRAAAPSGVTVVSVNASVSAITASQSGQAQAAGGLPVLNQTGDEVVGNITVSGTATSKDAVAAFADALSKVKGLAVPFPASITATTANMTYSVQVLLTSQVLGGRYSAPQAAGGK